MAEENKDKVNDINEAPDTDRIPKAAKNVPGEAVAVSHEKGEGETTCSIIERHGTRIAKESGLMSCSH